MAMEDRLTEAGVNRRCVLLVAESDDFLDGIASWLLKAPGLEVVGRAHSGHEAMDRVERLSPDLVLMDISLADMNGFEVTRRIKSQRPAPFVLLMTFHDSRVVGLAAMEAGADGCVSKTEVTDRLLPAIDALLGFPGQPPRMPDDK